MRATYLVLVLTLPACGSEVKTVEGSGGGADGGAATGAASSGGSGGAGNAGNASSGGGGTAGSGGHVGGSGGSGVACNPTPVACDAPIPFCPPGEVPSVNGACWGECVPILDCATEPNCDNCQGGFCAQYVAFVTEYRCVVPSLTCSALTCGCLAPYFCVEPFDACIETPSGPLVSCECTSC